MNQVSISNKKKQGFFSQTQLARSVVFGIILLFSFSPIISLKTVMTSPVMLQLLPRYVFTQTNGNT